MRKILVVDDDRFVRELLRGALQSVYEVTCVCDGTEAVQYAHIQPFDAVLLDINMPRTDGWATIAKLRSELSIAMPIIVVTAYRLPGDRARATNAGCSGFVSKPIVISELYSEIDRVFAPRLTQR
jgi:CheY-like chemotaxis protein